MGNTILAKGGNHILAKRDNSAWPKGSKLSGFSKLALSMDSQVDGVHATDLGMQQYADAYYKKITGILFPEQATLSFTPGR